jgi:hypothetical protein
MAVVVDQKSTAVDRRWSRRSREVVLDTIIGGHRRSQVVTGGHRRSAETESESGQLYSIGRKRRVGVDVARSQHRSPARWSSLKSGHAISDYERSSSRRRSHVEFIPSSLTKGPPTSRTSFSAKAKVSTPCISGISSLSMSSPACFSSPWRRSGAGPSPPGAEHPC